MNPLYETRKQFSLTQEEMGTWLGVSASLIAMAETYRRELPTKALIKLSQLGREFQTKAGKKEADKQRPQKRQGANPEISPKLKRRIMDCRFNSMRLERELSKMKAGYAESEIREESLKELRKTTSKAKEAQGERIILDLCEAKTKKIIKKCGPTQQALIAAQLYAANVELALLERHSNDQRDTLDNIEEKELLKMMKANTSKALNLR